MQYVQTLKITKTREMIFSAVFTLLAVYSPVLAHYFAGIDGGRIFLPMPFFVLLAGMIFGWRVGLLTAIMAPTASFLISGMPVLKMLPFILVQSVALSLAAGFLRTKFNIIYANASAVLAGWLAIGVALSIFSKMSGADYVLSGIRIGFPGIMLQLVLVPLIVALSMRNYKKPQ